MSSTSSGQEAFVDSILTALTTAFPTMIIPNRELVYQTLEKLIKDRKVYQTASGYFVVTPDTFRYMISSSPLPQPRSSSHPPSHQLLPAISTATLTLDSVNTPPDQPLHHDPGNLHIISLYPSQIQLMGTHLRPLVFFRLRQSLKKFLGLNSLSRESCS